MQLVDYDVLRDLADLTAGCGDQFMPELMRRFAGDARNALERIRACAHVGDAPRLAREAHRLKGTSGTVGAVALAEECLEMERCARAGRCAGMDLRVEHALTLLECTCGHMVEFIRGNTGAPA